MNNKIDGPFNRTDIQNIKNYSGKNEAYLNNIPNILLYLGLKEEKKNLMKPYVQEPTIL